MVMLYHITEMHMLGAIENIGKGQCILHVSRLIWKLLLQSRTYCSLTFSTWQMCCLSRSLNASLLAFIVLYEINYYGKLVIR